MKADMKYCRNCGKETTAKICPHCGASTKKSNKYCGWCGTEVDSNAVVCPNCHEKTKDSLMAKLSNILGVVAAVFLVIMGLAFGTENATMTTVMFIVAAVLLLPFIKNLIRKVTFGKKSLRMILSLGRIALVIVLLVGGCSAMPEAEPIPNKVYSDVATKKHWKFSMRK